MTEFWGNVRRRILTPNVSATRLDVRGFHEKDPAARQLLETVGRSFLQGYAAAAQASRPTDAEAPLEQVPDEFRGFAYEGAAMGFAVRDGLPFGRHDHAERFLAGEGARHVYMVYVGIGWAMARLPRFCWPDAERLDPLLRWLVLDGYGFHQAYFHTERYVRQMHQDQRFPWPAGPYNRYANRAIDQGIGRAIWFVAGTDHNLAASFIDRFPEERRPDLYSGAGLAATYAGGAGEQELLGFWHRAGRHRPLVAQASAFAAEARVRAGLVTPHTQLATEIFCGVPPERAAGIAVDRRPDPSVQGDLPAYEIWRQRVANQFMCHGRC